MLKGLVVVGLWLAVGVATGPIPPRGTLVLRNESGRGTVMQVIGAEVNAEFRMADGGRVEIRGLARGDHAICEDAEDDGTFVLVEHLDVGRRTVFVLR